MHLVQLLLPLFEPDGREVPRERFAAVRQTLVERFGGLTAYSRAPARGLWDDGEQVVRDDVVVYEVMVESLDRAWWREYRDALCRDWGQQEMLLRAHPVERL